MGKKIQASAKRPRKHTAPSLKSASGSGFSFEDKVAALLFCEMLCGKSSLGPDWGVATRIERQAGDWEPFGDILLTAINLAGDSAKCGCSVKSNRQLSANGCGEELRDGLWTVLSKPAFNGQTDAVGLFCAELSGAVSPVLNQLCKQARGEEKAERLDEKVKDAKNRKIYESFRAKNDISPSGLPWHVLKRLVPREFNFEDVTSRSEQEAIGYCRDILDPSDADGARPIDLWTELLDIARQLREVGGSVTRESLSGKLRNKFRLREDPSDLTAWHSIRELTHEWMEQIETILPGGLKLPRTVVTEKLKNTLATHRACHVIGESGAGKSALVKTAASHIVTTSASTQVVWIKSDQFSRTLTEAPNFDQVLLRARFPSGLLVFDSVEACYSDDSLKRIAQTIATVTADVDSPWKVVLLCQTSDWSRILRQLVKWIAGHDVVSKRIECNRLSPADMKLVFEASPSIHRLGLQPRLQRFLSSPKALDLLLRAQIAEDTLMASEADLIEWWWDDHIKQGRQVAEEEKIARHLATKMAQDLATELSPDAVEGSAAAVESLIKNRVLRRTRDGRFRFDHDLLADWSRVMHLRSLGEHAFSFMCANTENPPWLRAIRLMSQHLLERESDLNRWRAVVVACITKGNAPDETPTQNLQVLDAWLEGIPYCSDAANVLKSLRNELMGENGWLLQRFVRRLLRTGTIPDPIIQERFKQIDAKSAEAAAARFRWPLMFLWTPVIEFLIANACEVTDLIPIELAGIGEMWAQLSQYFDSSWRDLAEVVFLNGEKELRREVSGEYRRSDRTTFIDDEEPSIRIYATALLAASQFPDRVARFALKAAGRAPWDQGDVNDQAESGWLGEYEDCPFIGDMNYVNHPIESWPDGPIRRISENFFHAWFDTGAPLELFQNRPEIAREVSLALLIEWPKKTAIRGGRRTHVDHHGFTFDADSMYPVFWSKGPFLIFLRQNWKVGLELVIRLTNFATDRYEDWWPYEPRVSTTTFSTPQGEVSWKGNHQIYAWNRYNMNTSEAVTCALMALEKWFDEQLDAKVSITDAVQLIYRQGKSIAFAGVLVSIGKRHPEQFTTELKPLLFSREIYIYDLQAVRQEIGDVYWPPDSVFIKELRRQWAALPGRKTCLKELCCEWLLTNKSLEVVMEEVARMWRNSAAALPTDSKERMPLLRWASAFDRSLWTETTLPNGDQGWKYQAPEELCDKESEEAFTRQQNLLKWPYMCADLLEKRAKLSDDRLQIIWQTLSDWAPYEQVQVAKEADDNDNGDFFDHRHARAALLAVMLCLGGSWLDQKPERRVKARDEVRELLANGPRITAYSAKDIHDDCQGFLARSVVQCWAMEPDNPEWRGIAGGFVTAYRYRTVRHLFSEAFYVRSELRGGYEALEALALTFAVVRHEATRTMLLGMMSGVDHDMVKEWCDYWLPKFAEKKGPAWISDWSQIETVTPFPPKSDNSYGMKPERYKFRRRDYGLDIALITAAFGHLPPLCDAKDDLERAHWFAIAEQMIAAFCRTLPQEEASDYDEWEYEHWGYDTEVFKIAAARIVEHEPEQGRRLWRPILSLPPFAHYHITSFLNAVLIEWLRTEPPRVTKIIPTWREMTEHLTQSSKWSNRRWRRMMKVWKTILLYDGSSGGEVYGPLVDALRPHFETHAKRLVNDAHEQSSFVAFLTTKAGDRLLVDALRWFRESWQQADPHFWDIIIKRGDFTRLLDIAWREKQAVIRASADAFAAFKTLTLNLAAHHVPAALAVQEQLGSETVEK